MPIRMRFFHHRPFITFASEEFYDFRLALNFLKADDVCLCPHDLFLYLWQTVLPFYMLQKGVAIFDVRDQSWRQNVIGEDS